MSFSGGWRRYLVPSVMVSIPVPNAGIALYGGDLLSGINCLR